MNDVTADPDYRIFCEERLQDPYPLFHRLRAADPVHWCGPINLWLVTRFEDVFQALRDPRLSSNRTGMYIQALPPELTVRVQPLLDHVTKWLQQTDEPDHGRLRKLANSAFTPKIINALRPRIVELVGELLADLPAGPPFDLIEKFCGPLPAIVISELLGVPPADRDRFRLATARLVKFSSRGGPSLKDHAEPAHAALEELISMFEPLIAERRRAPKADLLSALVSATADGERLTNDELYAMCVFIFLAGHETTTSSIASGVLALLRHPDQFTALKADVDGRVGGAVEEILRYDSAVPRAVRLAREDMQIGEKHIQAGQLVVLLLGAANRDPAQFAEPDRFNISRPPGRHLAFGYGLHFCIGALLARIEIEVSLRAIVKRQPNLRLAGEQVTWKAIMGLRSLEALPVVAA